MDRVNVSVLLYVPVRSASLAPIACLNVIVTASLETGPGPRRLRELSRERPAGRGHLHRLRQRERAVDQLAGVGRARVGHAERSRRPRSRSRWRWCVAVYSRATPGVNAPNVAGVPSAAPASPARYRPALLATSVLLTM